MMISLLGWSLLSAFTTALSLVLFKKETHHRILNMFWVILINFIAFMLLFYGKQFLLGTSLYTTTEQFLGSLTEDIPFYLIDGFTTAIKLILYAYAFAQFRVSQLIPIIQVGTFVVTLGLYFLGCPLSGFEIASIIIISIGAVISGFERFYYPDIFTPLTTIPLRAYAIGFLITFMDSINQLILYIVTYKDHETIGVQSFVSTIKAFHQFRVGFMTSLQYYEGSLPWLMFFLLCYLLFIKKIRLEHLLKSAKTGFHTILILAAAKIAENYIFLYEFQATEDKALFIACCQFSIPLTLVLAYLHLNEEITIPEKVGAAMIVSGALLGALK